MSVALIAAIVLVSLTQQIVLGEQYVDPRSYLWSQVNVPSYSVNDVWLAHKHLPNFAEVERAAKDTFEYLPSKYLDGYRNPCWERDGQLKCLPYFQILGVSKCGTTDLYHRLTEHPDMAKSGWKGPHFWDEAPYRIRAPNPTRYDGSFPAYVGVFDKAAARIKENKNAITGEASSNTFTAVYSHLRGRTLPKRVNATLAEYLWEATPFARYIVMFRDPVSRYRSAYFYYRNKNLPPPTDADFLLTAKEDIRIWTDCVKEHGQLHCLKLYHPQQLVKGMYSDFLPGWLAVWPRDRFLFLRSEDYKVAPAAHVRAAVKFLGLSDLSPEITSRIAKLAARNTQSKKYDASAESPQLTEAYKLLRDFYRPCNQKLSQMFGDDPRWLWGY